MEIYIEWGIETWYNTINNPSVIGTRKCRGQNGLKSVMQYGMFPGVPLILLAFQSYGQCPETCCECGNRLLDRGTVVGIVDDKSIGFFADLLD